MRAYSEHASTHSFNSKKEKWKILPYTGTPSLHVYILKRRNRSEWGSTEQACMYKTVLYVILCNHYMSQVCAYIPLLREQPSAGHWDHQRPHYQEWHPSSATACKCQGIPISTCAHTTDVTCMHTHIHTYIHFPWLNWRNLSFNTQHTVQYTTSCRLKTATIR